MTQEQIYKEYFKLMLSCHDAATAHSFYWDQYIKLVEELEAIQSAYDERIKQEEASQVTPQTTFSINEELSRIKAGLELLKHLKLMQEKSKRKQTEAEQKLNTFCKRHGIENA